MTELLLYSRPNCPMCDEARSALERAGANFREIDISGDRGLTAEFGNHVPVVALEGRIVFEAGMNADQMEELLSSSA